MEERNRLRWQRRSPVFRWRRARCVLAAMKFGGHRVRDCLIGAPSNNLTTNNPLQQPTHHTFHLRLRPGRDRDGGRDEITKDAVARIATVAGTKPRLSRTRITTVAETKLRLSRDENREVARPPHTVDAISSSASPRRGRHPKIAFHTLSPPSGASPHPVPIGIARRLPIALVAVGDLLFATLIADSRSHLLFTVVGYCGLWAMGLAEVIFRPF
ncbi:hypothetical protein TIFTF001_003938 [Ficus carica]|uniref:Uncharacterized protein n=1 Tax=Ficus carica TaxID=3494 RepID=A0AA87ZVZ0_FICCA|nr:hypothetical protein TIFTF001_003938 [Ficus carica]